MNLAMKEETKEVSKTKMWKDTPGCRLMIE